MRKKRRVKRNHDKCSYHQNKDMNSDVYKLRRKVMDIIYEARKLINNDMHRITVRITECDLPHILGTARLNCNIIWIPSRTCSDKRLRHVVYHELCHALWGVEHDESCKLMNPIIDKACSKKTCQDLFIKYYKKHKKTNNRLEDSMVA